MLDQPTCSVANLESWIRANGGQISEKVVVKRVLDCVDGTHRGAFATDAGLPKDAVVCWMPRKLLLTETLARAALPFGDALHAGAVELHPNAVGLVMLAAFLVQEGAALQGGRRAGSHDSFFTPYFESLTTDLSYLPVSWNEDAQRRLRGSRLERQLKARRYALGLEFSLLQNCAPDLEVTLEEYTWARCTVSSRAYSLSCGKERLRCLVPWADLLNHGGRGQTAVHYAFVDGGDGGDGFLMRSDSMGVEPGGEILQSYGPEKSNAALWLDYGFVLTSQDPADTPVTGDAQATVSVSLTPSAGLHGTDGEPEVGEDTAPAERQKLWRSARRPVTGAAVDVTCADPGPLFSLLRVACANTDDLCAVRLQGVKDAHGVTLPISVANEHRVLERLGALVSATLSRLPAVFHVDDLRHNLLDQRHSMIAAYCDALVKEEAAVLAFYGELAHHALELISGNPTSSTTEWLAGLGIRTRDHALEYLASVATLLTSEA